MFAMAYSLLRNSADAEDVVQETFAGAYKSLRKFEERSSVKTWLSRILYNQVARVRRDRKRDWGPLKIESLDHANDPGLKQNPDAKLDLMATLDRMTAEHRDVLVLREIDQLSYEEIAEVLGVPRGTVESRLHRARADLKQKLQEYDQ